MKSKLKTHTKCPACGSANLINLSRDQLCACCDWNNISQTIQAGCLDALMDEAAVATDLSDLAIELNETDEKQTA